MLRGRLHAADEMFLEILEDCGRSRGFRGEICAVGQACSSRRGGPAISLHEVCDIGPPFPMA